MDKRTLSRLLTEGNFDFYQICELVAFSVIERPLRTPFYLDQLPDQQVWDDFRFTRENLTLLVECFKIDDVVRLENRSAFSGMEAFCILLRRLAYPNRYVDLRRIFGRLKPELSMVFAHMVEYLDDNFGYLLTSLDLCWLTREDFEKFTQAITEKGAPVPGVRGFIDGTFRPVCLPGEDQRTLFSGHYRMHGMKFQAIMAPNGLIANLDGPWPGRRHDSGMLAESGLLGSLEEKVDSIGKIYLLYGDPAYPISRYIEGPFRDTAAGLSDVEKLFNEDMSSVQIAVQGGFGEVVQQFAFLDFYKNLKIGLQPVGTLYYVGTLLTNCRVCFGHGGKVADFFSSPPPDVRTYLRNGVMEPAAN